MADSTATVLDLDRLRHDESAVVRRRVSQRLAELARTEPTLAVLTARRWLAEGGAHTEAIVRRGLKPLVDERDDAALRIAGYSPSAAVRIVDLVIESDPPPSFGDTLRFEARVVSNDVRSVPALVEYRINHRDREGAWRHRDGRLLMRVLDPLSDARIRRAHRLPPQPGSRWCEGDCRLVLRVNGRDDATATFTL